MLIGGSFARAEEAKVEPPAEQPWGDLTGRFTVDCDELRKARLFAVNKDEIICGKDMQSDTLAVNPKDDGLANAVIYLRTNPNQAQPPMHPDYEKSAKHEIPLDMSKSRFSPHAIALRSTQFLTIAIWDDISHHPVFSPFANERWSSANIGFFDERSHQFSKQEDLPFAATDACVPDMRGWILVRGDPYFAVTDESGRFEIKNLPVGEWTFQLWHEKSGYIQEGKRGGEPENWPKGRLTVKIASGKNNLGELRLSPKLFEDK